MAAKKNGKKTKTHQQLLAEAVKSAGSEAIIAEKLECSQQSVSAWIKGDWLPRVAIQKKMAKLYGIPMPWKKASVESANV